MVMRPQADFQWAGDVLGLKSRWIIPFFPLERSVPMRIFSIPPPFGFARIFPKQQPINILAQNRSKSSLRAVVPGSFPLSGSVRPHALGYLLEPFKSRFWLHGKCLSKAAFLVTCFIRLDQRMIYTSQVVATRDSFLYHKLSKVSFISCW